MTDDHAGAHDSPGRPSTDARALPILQKAYDFTKWMFGHTGKFPKSHRFSVAVRIENLCLDMLERIQDARRAETRLGHLTAMDAILQRLRLFLRLSLEQRFLSFGSYEHAVRSLDEIGRMLGGWMKTTRDLSPTPRARG